jgi:hypothetical protein
LQLKIIIYLQLRPDKVSVGRTIANRPPTSPLQYALNHETIIALADIGLIESIRIGGSDDEQTIGVVNLP